jgi:predicted Kef-type K+ transport protein
MHDLTIVFGMALAVASTVVLMRMLVEQAGPQCPGVKIPIHLREKQS